MINKTIDKPGIIIKNTMTRPKKRFPDSVRKYIRREKGRIRREVLSTKDQKEQIAKLLERVEATAPKKKTQEQPSNK